MNRSATKVFHATVAAAAAAVLVAPAAFGAGESKNLAPFTNHRYAAPTTQMRLGEPKNDWPFTRHIGS